MKRVLTGLQPTGSLTLGNYIGAIKQMVKMQENPDFENFLFIADMHAITVSQNPEELHKNIKSLVALYLAAGIDPNKNTIYIQSENIYHANVGWILECMTPYGQLGRMTQFKDKSQKNQNFYAGLFTYPVLMAADILLYDADLVPTGQDQKQHVELARDIAEGFNKKYNVEFFKMPEPYIQKSGAKIAGLVDPTKKMSKSAENKKDVIYLLDDLDLIRKKIMSATTDSDMVVKYDPENKPGISNLIMIYSELTGKSLEEIEQEFNGQNYGTFKTKVADVVVEFVDNLQQKYNEYLNSEELDRILDNGKQKTEEIAKKKYEELKRIVGLYR
jgi:tryptophanyl-tRNA synthetase